MRALPDSFFENVCFEYYAVYSALYAAALALRVRQGRSKLRMHNELFSYIRKKAVALK